MTSRNEVSRACLEALRELVEAAETDFQSRNAPHHELHLPFWAGADREGRWESREYVVEELDAQPIFLWHVDARARLRLWNLAAGTLQSYVDEHEIAPIAMRVRHQGDRLLWTFAQAYMEQEHTFEFVPERATALANEMLDVLDSPIIGVTSVLVLEGFNAAEEFNLESNIRIRPIGHTEIRELAQLNIGGFGLPAMGLEWPNADWWVAHFTVQSRRGTNEDLIRTNNRRDALEIALHAFKEGGGRFRHGYTKAESPFEAFGTSWCGGYNLTPARGNSYELSSTDNSRIHRVLGPVRRCHGETTTLLAASCKATPHR